MFHKLHVSCIWLWFIHFLRPIACLYGENFSSSPWWIQYSLTNQFFLHFLKGPNKQHKYFILGDQTLKGHEKICQTTMIQQVPDTSRSPPALLWISTETAFRHFASHFKPDLESLTQARCSSQDLCTVYNYKKTLLMLRILSWKQRRIGIRKI